VRNPLIAVAKLAAALGQTPISGVWECRIDDAWYVAARGAACGEVAEVSVEPAGCMKVELQPFEMGVWFNGWLAGLLGPWGGQFAAGEVANEKAFCAAVETRQRQADRPKE